MERLFIDLEKCDSCKKCVIDCAYAFHPSNNGIVSLRELAVFSLLCRKCEEAPCVKSCYHNALKKEDDGIVKRARFLCTACKTCGIACPFGVILPDLLNFFDSRCDYCLKRDKTLCITTCPYGAIEKKYIAEEDIDKGIYFVSDRLAVRYKKWFSDDTILYKKR
ncbi:MAG: 4Fe-4S dicluster domain-containing protein [Candidatus Omnitrophota bacterium]